MFLASAFGFVLTAVVLAWPLFLIIVNSPSVLSLTLVIAVLGVIMAFYFGPLPALMTSLFPSEVRTSGLSVSYNVGVTLLGGVRTAGADLAHRRDRLAARAERLLHRRGLPVARRSVVRATPLRRALTQCAKSHDGMSRMPLPCRRVSAWASWRG